MFSASNLLMRNQVMRIPVAEVGANGVRGAASAQYAVDKDPDTRWANQAVGSFIQLDLGIKKALCAIDIAWYRGDVRSYNFVYLFLMMEPILKTLLLLQVQARQHLVKDTKYQIKLLGMSE